MVVCAVLGCDSHSRINTDYTFHRLPRTLLPRARWLVALGRPFGTVGSCPSVCSRHFAPHMFAERGGTKALIKNAMPTLFLPPKVEQKNPLPVNLENRLFVKKVTFLTNQLSKAKHAIRALKKQQKPRTERPQIKSGAVKVKKPVDIEPEASGELLACRVCLAVDGRLLPISGSGFEDSFAELTGVPLSMAEGLPRHLCAFCRAALAKCAAFRDRCQRSNALLQTQLVCGPVTMTDIKGIDRNSHKLTHGLTKEKVFHFLTHPFLQIPPEIKIEGNETTNEAAETPNYTEIEYLEVDNDVGSFIKDTNTDSSKVKIEKQKKIKKVKLEAENSENDEFIDTELDGDTDDLDMKYVEIDINIEKAQEIIELQKKARSDLIKLKQEFSTKSTEIDADNTELHFNSKRKRKGDDIFPLFNYEAFEKEFNVKIELLSKTEQRQEIEERKRKSKSKFCCEKCGKGYNSEKTMNRHLFYHDPNVGPVECEICRIRFRKKTEFRWRRHRDAHRLRITCGDCGLVTRDKTTAKTHSLVHKGKLYACRHCEQAYQHRTSYYNHMREQHPGENVACDECGETFLSAHGVRMHKERGHRPNAKPKAELKCSVCDVTFSNTEALNKHTELSVGVSHAALYPCVACGESCGSDAALAAHAAKDHPPGQHHCDECDQTFVSATSFATHVRRKHLNERGGRARKNRPPRKRGSGPAPRVVCEVCGRSIQSEAALKTHLYTHLAQKPFACPHCPKTFISNTAREFHIRVHTGERPYQCDQCPLACSLKNTLVRHIERVHLKQHRSFSCEVCHKSFTERSSVKLHVRTVHHNLPAPKRVRRAKRPAE